MSAPAREAVLHHLNKTRLVGARCYSGVGAGGRSAARDRAGAGLDRNRGDGKIKVFTVGRGRR